MASPGCPSGRMEREVFDMSKLREKISALEEASDDGCCEGAPHMCDLPMPVKRCLFALDKLQGKRLSIEAQFRRDVMQLERKYHSLFEPLSRRRASIVSGASEPLPEELEGFEGSGVEEVRDGSVPDDVPPGIPSFWLTCLLRHPDIEPLITETDAKALEHLQDIRFDYLDDNLGFRLEFHFSPNEYFSNKMLGKEYRLAEAEHGTPVYDHAVGTSIDWKAGKNLCFKTIVRSQRHRSNNTTRTVKREERTESFFHFFSPPVPPQGDAGDEADKEADELEEQMQFDYELGELFKEQVIPNALGWFTGLALEDWESEGEEDDEGEDEEYDDYDEEGDDDEEEEEDDDEGPVAAPARSANPKERQVDRKAPSAEKPECKQQ